MTQDIIWRVNATIPSDLIDFGNGKTATFLHLTGKAKITTENKTYLYKARSAVEAEILGLVEKHGLEIVKILSNCDPIIADLNKNRSLSYNNGYKVKELSVISAQMDSLYFSKSKKDLELVNQETELPAELPSKGEQLSFLGK